MESWPDVATGAGSAALGEGAADSKGVLSDFGPTNGRVSTLNVPCWLVNVKEPE